MTNIKCEKDFLWFKCIKLCIYTLVQKEILFLLDIKIIVKYVYINKYFVGFVREKIFCIFFECLK